MYQYRGLRLRTAPRYGHILFALFTSKHSPDGFQWGYGGSGPADLALSILVDYLSDKDKAFRLHQSFKWDFVAGFKDTWQITGSDIEAWLKAKDHG